MKKIILVIFIFLFSITLSGCNKDKPAIIFSTKPFNNETMYKPQNIFHKGERIYYAVYNPDNFKTRLLKLQVFKKESEKSEHWGYEYLYNRTLELKNKKTFADYIVINNTGIYVFQIFDFTDFQQPVVIGIIKVVE